jgi:hypothetical protein
MGGSYRQCSECGKRALSIATRCPGCGRELPAPEADAVLDLRRFLSPRVLGGIIATIAVLTAAAVARSRRPLEQQSSLAVAQSTSALSAVAYTTTAAARLDTVTVAPCRPRARASFSSPEAGPMCVSRGANAPTSRQCSCLATRSSRTRSSTAGIAWRWTERFSVTPTARRWRVPSPSPDHAYWILVLFDSIHGAHFPSAPCISILNVYSVGETSLMVTRDLTFLPPIMLSSV